MLQIIKKWNWNIFLSQKKEGENEVKAGLLFGAVGIVLTDVKKKPNYQCVFALILPIKIEWALNDEANIRDWQEEIKSIVTSVNLSPWADWITFFKNT